MMHGIFLISVITCWKCSNKTDNVACNKWAPPDMSCPYSKYRILYLLNML